MMNKQLFRPNGFTMIEMLVALLVLSVGLLGIAALQTTGQQANYRAYVRTQATWLAYDMMDKMRHNQQVASAYVHPSSGFTDEGPGGQDYNTKCDTSDCTPEELAAYDLDNWFARIRENLPSGVAQIEADAVPGRYHIRIGWINPQSDDTQITQAWVLQL
ncbi:type IV pilus modification protein PilV [Thioflexithrix psekupsensis]|uniref:Type IV pilus modification protein PilV n=1 Tax=Thioflexithrix psekupsensis TaxID=1570016 RepID=A0A251X801_9GAMM|nr:type IV pilus modification protein PilV [Thioflexithrix psekupsensis]OUD14179.1 type IV pilus modification protein PilV [Thioflexithrix psekupsensis]